MSVGLIIVACLAVVSSAIPSPSRFKNFLDNNISPGTKMPLSYTTYPADYFDKVPASLRPHDAVNQTYVPPCKRVAQPSELNDYQFQTERYITALGLNIYDGAVWCIAQTTLGDTARPRAYIASTLLGHKTLQFGDIRGDATCKGDQFKGRCNDTSQSGFCGFCYGDADQTLDNEHAYFFRSISDYYSLQGTADARCPEKKIPWTWNDYKPILGENAWANLLGPLHTVYVASGKNPASISLTSPEMLLATRIVTALKAMRVGNYGAVYYAPHNTYFAHNPNAGATISIENQASLMAGLKALSWVLQHQPAADPQLVQDVAQLITGLQRFLLSAWNPATGYFRQGATYDPDTKVFQWKQGTSPPFAVDCQTWTATVLGPDVIDTHLGQGTSKQLWETTKSLAGYQRQPSGMVKGVGYTANSYSGEVLSGEWTLGAINWLRLLASHNAYSAADRQAFQAEAEFMRASLESEMVVSTPVQHGTTPYASMLYANRRYKIPFGWWANSIPSLASTGWAVLVDSSFNPFMLTGAYTATYPSAPTPPSPIPPSPSCKKCTSGTCCNPLLGQMCPGNVPCCDCGSSACQC